MNEKLSISQGGVEDFKHSELLSHITLYLQTVRGILLPINILNMEVASFSETSVNIYQFTRSSYPGRFKSAITEVSK